VQLNNTTECFNEVEKWHPIVCKQSQKCDFNEMIDLREKLANLNFSGMLGIFNKSSLFIRIHFYR